MRKTFTRSIAGGVIDAQNLTIPGAAVVVITPTTSAILQRSGTQILVRRRACV